MHVEQAILISSGSGAKAFCALAARSRGLGEGDARELSDWGPPRDALVDENSAATCLSFFRLASGNYVVAQTVQVQSENRRHPDVRHHCFIVSPEAFRHFSNNPVSLFNAVQSHEGYHQATSPPPEIRTFELSGSRPPQVDQALLASAIGNPGVTWLGALIQAAVTKPLVALADVTDHIRLFAMLFSSVPLECRTECSFSTGLRTSESRPWRFYCLGEAPAERYQALRNNDVAVLDMAGKPPSSLSSASGWSGFVTSAIVTRRTGFLAEQLSQPRSGLQMHDLNSLGDQLLECLAAASSSGGDPSDQPPLTWTARDKEMPLPTEPVAAQHRSDSAHDRFQRIVAAATATAPPMMLELASQPSDHLGPNCPQALELLERLDDLVFETIAGKKDAMVEMRSLWPQVQAMVGPQLVEESRVQYVRHAIDVWRECLQGDEIRNPALAVTAMEVLELLFSS